MKHYDIEPVKQNTCCPLRCVGEPSLFGCFAPDTFPRIALCHGCGRRSTADDSELCAVCYLTKQAAAQLTHDQLVILLENLTHLAYPPEPLILAPYEKKR